MNGQLFYTYTGTATGIASEKFGIGSDYSYSLVFDKKRKSLWTQGLEFGIAQVEWDEANADYRQSWKGYKNVEYSLFVNDKGHLQVDGFAPIEIRSFDMYDNSSQISTGKMYEFGEVLSTGADAHELRFSLEGGSVDKGTVQSITLTGNNATVGGVFPKPSPNQVSITPSTTPNYQNYTYEMYSGTAEDVWNGVTGDSTLRVTLTVQDARGNQAQSTIDAAVYNDKWYYWCDSAKSTNYNIISAIPGFRSGWTGELGSTAATAEHVPASGNQDYFWFMHPARLGVASCKTDMGELEWARTYPETVQFINAHGYMQDYRLYRSNKANIGGLAFWITFS